MKRAFGFLFAVLPFVSGSSAQAAEPAAPHAAPAAVVHAAPGPLAGPTLAARLAGHTMSVVAFVPRRPGAPGGGQLTRLLVQAYFSPGGRALVRVWDPGGNVYTVPGERPWTLTGSTLCLDVPAPGNGLMCADMHVWGARIAGVGVQPSYAMLDGDLKPGNVIGGRR